MRPHLAFSMLAIALGAFGLFASLTGEEAAAGNIASPRVQIGWSGLNELSQWKNKSFKGETAYRLVQTDGGFLLRAECNASASAIYRERTIDLRRTPILRWSWRVDHVFQGLNDTTKEGDDYAARIYVIHNGGWKIWRTYAVDYVWSNSQSKGSSWPNAFTSNAMMVAVESGSPKNRNEWVSESRNIRDDFRRFFRLDLEELDGVAIMTDCDNSGRSGAGYYRDIYFSAK